MYIRFEMADGLGLFHAWRLLPRAERGRPRSGASKKAAETFDGLHALLTSITPVPPPRAYEDTMSRKPRTWFKESAVEPVQVAWRVCRILNRHGVAVRPRRSKWPGTVLYEDEVQVVVRPRRVYSLKQKREKGAGWSGDRTTIRRWGETRRLRWSR